MASLLRIFFGLLMLLSAGLASGEAGAPKPCWESEWQAALDRAAVGSVADREYLAALTLGDCQNLGRLAKILLEDLEGQNLERLKAPIPVESVRPDFSKLDLDNERVFAPGLLLRLMVDSSGRVREVKIEKSSGNVKIDEFCIEALGHSLYRPARDKGRYLASVVMISVHIHVR